MLKKLLILALVKKLLLLALLVIWGSYAAQALTEDEFQELYPEAEQEGNCYLLKLDDCNVVAVTNDYPAEHEIALIFVQNKQKQKSQDTAKRIAKDIPDSEVVPFVGADSSVAIFCPISGLSTMSPLRVLLYPASTCRSTTQFIGWQGKCIKARIDLETLPGNDDSSRKKTKGIIEMTVNLEESIISSAEFRLTKGKLSVDNMRNFICERIRGTSNASELIPKLSVQGTKDLRSIYANSDVIAYSSSYDFCIVSKSKIYRAGTLDGVKDAVRSNKRDNVAFKYPQKNHPWPHDEIDNEDSAFATTAERVNDVPRTKDDNETTQKNNSATPTPPKEAVAATTTPNSAEAAQNIEFSKAKVADISSPICRSNESATSALTPAQASKTYLERLQKL